LAGLGIAGLAVSLAAQDSLKNLFGSITILLDRPFRVGQRIVYAGYDGTVEEIGFRSTRLRTLTGNLVNIPNSKIVNDPIENIGVRPAIQRVINVTITYDTPREKIQQAVNLLRGILEEPGIGEPIHPVINDTPTPPRVFFNDFNADSLNIFVIYWYAPPSWWDYMAHAEKLNFRIFEEFEKAGIEFAFPTRTLYLADDPKRRLRIETGSSGA
jgi:MscS family membrane protein